MSYFLNYSEFTGFGVNTYRKPWTVLFLDFREMLEYLASIDHDTQTCVNIGNGDFSDCKRAIDFIKDTTDNHKLYKLAETVEDTITDFEYCED